MSSPDLRQVQIAAEAPAGALVIRPLFEGRLAVDGSALDEATDAFAALAGFTGESAQTCPVAVGDTTQLLVGLGPRRTLSAHDAAAAVSEAMRRMRHTDAVLAMPTREFGPVADDAELVAALASAAVTAGYGYRRDVPTSSRGPQIVLVTEVVGADEAVARGEFTGRAVNLVRDLVNEPAATMTPTRFVEHARAIAHDQALDIRVWDADDIAENRLGGLAAVASGSRQPAYLIRLEHAGEPAEPGPITALVGKGVTFDSGGLSLKSADYMTTMKIDMCGAATVLGAMSALGPLGITQHVRAYLPVTENMPGGAAARPGDIAVMRNGLQVEIINTDAEGRLILADAMAVAVDEGADRLIDVASLTGACRVALGTSVAGVMGNDESWTGEVLAAAQRAGERMWPLPLIDEYKAQLETPVADLRNVGRPVRPNEGGAIVAALFLRDFVANRPWTHIDMGGPAYHDVETTSLAQGSTGFGVRTLLALLTGTTCARPNGRQDPSAESA